MSFSEFILVGNVGRSPILHYTSNGTAVCNFSLAVNRRRRQGDEWIDETDWYTITVWGQQAETVSNYVTKGRQVLAVGDRMEIDTYTSKEGEERTGLKLTARVVRFLGRAGDDAGDNYQGGPRSSSYSASGSADYDNYDDIDDGLDGPSQPDDIPF